MVSYWEQQSFSYYDHIIIGSGIVGLSLSVELAALFPGKRILVLERGLLPTGASTRNAGFACMGSATELLDDLQHTAADEVVQLFAARKEGLGLLRSRLGDAPIGYDAAGSHELIRKGDEHVADRLDYLNALLEPVLGKAAFNHVHSRKQHFGFPDHLVATLIENTCEGAINTGKMMRALLDIAMQSGVEIKTGTLVRQFSDGPSGAEVVVEDRTRGDVLLRCATLSICTNAFTRTLLPGEDVVPGRGQVVVTRPIPGLKLKGIFHFDKGYYYFREIDGRVLFGGGRNLDFAGEQTTDMSLSQLIQADLEDKLANMILPGTQFGIEYRWAGIMAFGATKQPIVKCFGDRVFGAFRMGGMGVALGTGTAADLARLISEKLA